MVGWKTPLPVALIALLFDLAGFGNSLLLFPVIPLSTHSEESTSHAVTMPYDVTVAPISTSGNCGLGLLHFM